MWLCHFAKAFGAFNNPFVQVQRDERDNVVVHFHDPISDGLWDAN